VAGNTDLELRQPNRSPPHKRRSLFSTYDKQLATSTASTSKQPSVSSVMMQYIDSLPSLSVQARGSKKPLEVLMAEKQFLQLHPLFEKLLCIPATSAPVERIFSHGGLFMRPHRARLGVKVLSDLVFTKCNRHLNGV